MDGRKNDLNEKVKLQNHDLKTLVLSGVNISE
jgi:hypothetical protein